MSLKRAHRHEQTLEDSLCRWAGSILVQKPILPDMPSCDPVELRRFLLHHGVQAALLGAGRRRGSLPFPTALADMLHKDYRHLAAVELARVEEVARVLRLANIHLPRPVVLFKGTALAYQIYPEPHTRTRGDTDAIIDPAHVSRLLEVLGKLGYATRTTIDSSLIMQQNSLVRTDALNIVHTWDVHWKFSNRPAFADILGYDDLLRGAVQVRMDDVRFLAPNLPDGLLIACLHLIGHHSGDIRLIWLYDIHLLIEALSDPEYAGFVHKARSRGEAQSACHAAISLAQRYLPGDRTDELRRALDPGTGTRPVTGQSYAVRLLRDGRALDKGDRLRFVREHLFPSPDYMMRRFGFKRRWQLPFWYGVRIARAVPKLFRKR